jgi:hypothetical protein
MINTSSFCTTKKNEGHFLATYFVSKGHVTEKKERISSNFSSRQTLTNLGYI